MQFSIFTSIVRLHGTRGPKRAGDIPLAAECDPTAAAGGPVEPWVYGGGGGGGGGGVYLAAIKSALALRRSLLPYLKAQLQALAADGVPVMRPLFFDAPDDAAAAAIDDQFFWGPGFMVAPILQPNATSRLVYFPAGATYTDHFTGTTYAGGKGWTVPVAALDYFPLYTVERD